LPLKPEYSGELIQITNSDKKIFSYFSKLNDKLVVIFHGNAGTIQMIAPWGKKMTEMGFSVLLVEYPGYGIASDYESSESAIYSDSEEAVRYVQQKYGFTKENTIGLGYSLGTAVSVELATRDLFHKIILIAPFTSIPAVASEKIFPIIPYLIIWDRFNTISKAEDISISVLIFHGKKDQVIPYEMGEKLGKEFPNVKFISLPDSDHHVFQFISESNWKIIYNFIKS
jgi:pimeloyl-ACP methyl ester carboxylesterase